MTMRQANSENQFYPQAMPDGVNSQLVANGDVALKQQDNACKVLKQYFDDLELSLSDVDETVDISQLQTIWLEISD
ncbi:MAG: hypothetical protein PVG22_16235, partial [Chromatiales bacterium]